MIGIRRTATSVVSALLAAVLCICMAPPAQAATIVGGACTSQSAPMKWWGGLPVQGQSSDSWPRGTVYVCYTKYRLADADSSGDYYQLVAESYWTKTSGPWSYPATMYQTITSNKTSVDSYYRATNSFTSDTSTCSDVLEFGISVAGVVGVSVRPKLCPGVTVSRYLYSSSKAGWTTGTAGGLQRLSTTYLQKVPNGTVPTFTVSFGIPQYTNTYDTAGLYWRSTAKIVYVTLTK